MIISDQFDLVPISMFNSVKLRKYTHYPFSKVLTTAALLRFPSMSIRFGIGCESAVHRSFRYR